MPSFSTMRLKRLIAFSRFSESSTTMCAMLKITSPRSYRQCFARIANKGRKGQPVEGLETAWISSHSFLLTKPFFSFQLH
jgi:hypothetical protein